MNVIEAIEKEQLRSDIPDFRPGDTLKVYVKVVEGNRERVQLFEGVCISRNGTGVREMFTVRRIASGVGVERTFPVAFPASGKDYCFPSWYCSESQTVLLAQTYG